MRWSSDVKEKEFKLLKPGKAQFEIIEADEGVTKKGDPKISLKIHLWDSNNDTCLTFENLTSAMNWKIKHLMESIGRGDKFQNGTDDFFTWIGKKGECEIYVEKSEQYGDRVKIKDYIKSEKEDKFIDDDVPF
jgi:hypothetical protein